MAKVTIVTSGDPFSPSGIGSGSTLVSNSVSQTFALADTSQAKFWLAGNGASSILIISARLIQGTKNIPVTVNGATSFYVPETGRWSDYVSIADFNLPGNVTLTVTFEGTVMFPTFSDNSIPEDPMIVSVTETLSGAGLAGEILFQLNFEGSFIDSINGFTPSVTTNFSLETDPANVLFGSGSVKFTATSEPLNPAYLIYPTNPTFVSACMENGFTLSTFWKFTTPFAGLPANTYGHGAQVIKKDGDNFLMYVFYNGQSAGEPTPMSAATVQGILENMTSGMAISGWIDGYQIIKGAVWTENFTPPAVPFAPSVITEPIELTFNSSITLTSNPEEGDTLTLKGGTAGNITFTFVNHYPNNQYEIQIGATVNDTAANIATAINDIVGAEFIATATDNVITVTAYTTSFSMEETGSVLTLGVVTCTLDGLITEDINVDDSFTATDGGKAVQENVSVSDAMDGLIDGINEEISVAAHFDVPMDELSENISVSTNIDGLIDMMGESND